ILVFSWGPLPLFAQDLPLLGFEALFLCQDFQLGADVRQRLEAELRDRSIVRHRREKRADLPAQLVDSGPRLVDIGSAVDCGGAVLDLLVQIRHALLKGFKLLLKFLNRRCRSAANDTAAQPIESNTVAISSAGAGPGIVFGINLTGERQSRGKDRAYKKPVFRAGYGC